jgi:hypothetical protein
MRPVLLEDVHVQERIPGRGRLGEGVGLARECIQAITAHAVAPFDMHEGRLLDRRAEGRPRLDAQQTTPLVAALDGLREAHSRRQAPRWASASSRAHRSAIGARRLFRIGPPAVAAPGKRLSRRAPLGLREDPRGQLLLTRAAGMRHHEAAGAVDHQAPPALSHPSRLAGSRRRRHRGGRPIRRRIGRCPGAVLLRTKDQNSSTPTVGRCRSCTGARVSASAWRAARWSQRPIVS